MTSGPNDAAPSQVTVVGAGIIGVSCALALQRAGFQVTVVDRQGPGEACSYGNCGGIAPTEFMPLSQPGYLLKVPGWLLDPTGPLAVKWSYMPRLAPWLLQFLAAGRRARVRAIATAAIALCKSTWDDHQPLLAAAGIADIVQPDECLSLYDTDADLRADRPRLDFCAEHGLAVETIDGRTLCELEPDLAPDFAWGVINHGWHHVSDPFRVVTALADLFVARGGRLQQSEVARIETSGGGAARLHLRGGESLPVQTLVIAAGAWSHQLARQLGDRIPLESDRGYHTTIPDPGVNPKRQIVHGAQGLAITPLAMGLRIGGSVELAGLETPPNYSRARAQVKRAKRVYPGLTNEEGSRWMGHRPSLPDSLPVIGRAPGAANVYYAFGHGHLGLTLGPTTGRLIAELMSGTTPTIDMSPYRAERFGS